MRGGVGRKEGREREGEGEKERDCLRVKMSTGWVPAMN